MFSALDISASGLYAQRTRMDVIANNIASANITNYNGTAEPYRRREVLFEAGVPGANGVGVHVPRIVEDYKTDFHRAYQPGHPDADAEGYVRNPNVDILREMVDMMSATRSYEANVAAMDATKSMMSTSLRIIA